MKYLSNILTMKYLKRLIIIIIVLYYVSPDTYYYLKNKISNNLPNIELSVNIDDKKVKKYDIINKNNNMYTDTQGNDILNKNNNVIQNFTTKDF